MIVWWLLALLTIDVGGDDEDDDGDDEDDVGDDVADDDDHEVVVEGLLGPLTIDQTLDTPTGLAPRINTLYPPDNGPSCSREV